MFRVFRSPFSATFLKGSFGLLGLVALSWALQQNVGSPRFLRAQTGGNQLVVDDHSVSDNDLGCTIIGAAESHTTAGYGGDFTLITANPYPGIIASAQWNFTLPSAGLTKDVFVTFPVGSMSAVLYEIYDGSTLIDTVTVDQTVAPSGNTYGGFSWLKLGTQTFSSTAVSVKLRNSSDTGTGYLRLVADAARLADASSADCWPEGWIDAGGKPCCAGLTSIQTEEEVALGGGGILCREVVPGNTCAACGNGTCNSQYENRCNCPGDCGPLPGGSSSSSSSSSSVLQWLRLSFSPPTFSTDTLFTTTATLTNDNAQSVPNAWFQFFDRNATFLKNQSSPLCGDLGQGASVCPAGAGGTTSGLTIPAGGTQSFLLPFQSLACGQHSLQAWAYMGATAVANGSLTFSLPCSSSAAGGTAVCGNGIKEAGEDCKEPGTGTCTSPQECIQCKCQLSQQIQCGNLTGHTGGCWHVGGACSILCQPNNHVLMGLCDSQNNCFGYCGNNKLDPGEVCDRGDPSNDPACTEFCTVRSGWTCTGSLGSPSTCTQNAVSSASSAVSVNDLILDDADPGFMSYLGTWAASTSGFRGGQHVHAPGPQDWNTPLEWGGWGTTVNQPGDYKIYATWVPSSGYSSKVTYEIDRSIGLVSLPSESSRWTRQDVNQKAAPQASFSCNGKNWQLLGNVSVTSQYRYLGIFAYAENTAPRNSQFAIDAVMLTPSGQQPGCVNTIFCGNGIKESGEACDDGNTNSGDGCAYNCAVETGWTCTGSAPSVCTRPAACGNGVMETGEQCEKGAVHYGVGSVPASGESTSNGNTVYTGYAALGVGGVTVADVTGDGKPDLVIANNTNSKPDTPKRISVLPGNGDGTFASRIDTDVVSLLPALGIGNIITGQFDGDGNADVLLLEYQTRPAGSYDDSQKVRIAKGNGNGTFQALAPILPDDPAVRSMKVGDFNADGNQDILVIMKPTSTGGPSSARLYLAKPDHTFQTPTQDIIATTLANGSPYTGDFDADGHLDFLWPFTGVVHVLFGKGDGTFNDSSVTLSNVNPLAVGDVTGDGRTDFVTPDGAFVAQSNRTFKGNTIPLIPTYARFFGLADMNGDGQKDLLHCSDAMCWYNINVSFGLGTGVFQNTVGGMGPRIISFPVNTEAAVLTADFNQDGRDDLVFREDWGGTEDPGVSVYMSTCSSGKMCASCQCSTISFPQNSSSSSAVSTGPACGNGQVDSGETCDYAAANTCAGGQMCSASCSCVTCNATGTPVEFESELSRIPDVASIPDVVKLDAAHALVVYYSRWGGAKARVATINGSDVTLGTAAQFGEAPPTGTDASPIIASAVDATHAIIAYPALNQCKAVLATVNGTSVSFSTPTVLFQSFRHGNCDISFDGTAVYRRFDSRVIEKGIATITGNQISWEFSEQDLFMNSTYDRVPIGGGKDMRLLSWTVVVQRWPTFASLLAYGLGGNYAVALCNENDEYCNCFTSGPQTCVEFPMGFAGGKIVPVGGNQYQIFTRDTLRAQWKVTSVTKNGTTLTAGTPVALADFSFGTTVGSIPAVSSGRFFVDVHPQTYGVQQSSGFLRLDVGATGTVSLHTSSAGTFLTPASYVRAYKEGGSYPNGKLQVLNQCTAGPSSSSSSFSSQNSVASSASSLGGTCGNHQLDPGEECDPSVTTFVAQCGGLPCNPVTCRCPGHSSSSVSIGVQSSSSVSSSTSSVPILGSSSSRAPAVCGNATVEGGEECELGVCCHNGFSCDTRTCQCTPLGQVPQQSATCGNFRIETGEDCEDGISTPQLPCEGTATCNPQTCRCPGGMARCARWRSTP